MSKIALSNPKSLLRNVLNQVVEATEEVQMGAEKTVYHTLPLAVAWDIADSRLTKHNAEQAAGHCLGCLDIAKVLIQDPKLTNILEAMGEHWSDKEDEKLGLVRRRIATLRLTQRMLTDWGGGQDNPLYYEVVELNLSPVPLMSEDTFAHLCTVDNARRSMVYNAKKFLGLVKSPEGRDVAPDKARVMDLFLQARRDLETALYREVPLTKEDILHSQGTRTQPDRPRKDKPTNIDVNGFDRSMSMKEIEAMVVAVLRRVRPDKGVRSAFSPEELEVLLTQLSSDDERALYKRVLEACPDIVPNIEFLGDLFVPGRRR